MPTLRTLLTESLLLEEGQPPRVVKVQKNFQHPRIPGLKIAIRTTFSNGWYVETSWDRQSRNWYTNFYDKNDYDDGWSAKYDGNRSSGEYSHKHLVSEILSGEKTFWDQFGLR